MKIRKELAKIGRVYFILIITVILITGIACGSLMASNNTRAMSIGEHEARVVLSHHEKSLSLTVQEKNYNMKTRITEDLLPISRLAPAPLSSFFWIAENVVEIIKK